LGWLAARHRRRHGGRRQPGRAPRRREVIVVLGIMRLGLAMAAHIHDRIVSDPAIMRGKPTIRGSRITVELILDELGQGASIDDLVRDYPHLTREDVLAALRFAADWLRHDEIEFGPPAAA
jgi:uncharacterized protein (DUF433 family)